MLREAAGRQVCCVGAARGQCMGQCPASHTCTQLDERAARAHDGRDRLRQRLIDWRLLLARPRARQAVAAAASAAGAATGGHVRAAARSIAQDPTELASHAVGQADLPKKEAPGDDDDDDDDDDGTPRSC